MESGAGGSGPRAALYSAASRLSISSSSFPPFIAFALPVSPSFNPHRRAVCARSRAPGRPAPQETGVGPLAGPALLKARLRRRHKFGVGGGGSQPWSGTIPSPSCVSPSMTWRKQPLSTERGVQSVPSRLPPLLFPPFYGVLGCSCCWFSCTRVPSTNSLRIGTVSLG